MPIVGKITKIEAKDAGYVVFVDLTTEYGTYQMTIEAPDSTDYAEATNVARTKIYQLGAALQNTFHSNGTLK